MSEREPGNKKSSEVEDSTKQDSSTAQPRPPELVVGLGASAGGIGALKEFFSQTPPTTGASYVVILHLAPDHESRLSEVLQTTTRMPVTQARWGRRDAPRSGLCHSAQREPGRWPMRGSWSRRLIPAEQQNRAD